MGSQMAYLINMLQVGRVGATIGARASILFAIDIKMAARQNPKFVLGRGVGGHQRQPWRQLI